MSNGVQGCSTKFNWNGAKLHQAARSVTTLAGLLASKSSRSPHSSPCCTDKKKLSLPTRATEVLRSAKSFETRAQVWTGSVREKRKAKDGVAASVCYLFDS